MHLSGGSRLFNPISSLNSFNETGFWSFFHTFWVCSLHNSPPHWSYEAEIEYVHLVRLPDVPFSASQFFSPTESFSPAPVIGGRFFFFNFHDCDMSRKPGWNSSTFFFPKALASAPFLLFVLFLSPILDENLSVLSRRLSLKIENLSSTFRYRLLYHFFCFLFFVFFSSYNLFWRNKRENWQDGDNLAHTRYEFEVSYFIQVVYQVTMSYSLVMCDVLF